jgi:hypothetical protein
MWVAAYIAGLALLSGIAVWFLPREAGTETDPGAALTGGAGDEPLRDGAPA